MPVTIQTKKNIISVLNLFNYNYLSGRLSSTNEHNFHFKNYCFMYSYLKLIERTSKLWIFVPDYNFIANLLKNAHNYGYYANRDVMY